MKKTKVLFIAHESYDELEKVKHYLEKENYEINIEQNVKTKKISETILPNLILIDLENDYDSIELCYNLRENPELSHTSIVILSSKNDIYSQIASFNAGADDYILKPINHRVLIHKIKSLIRRTLVFPEHIKIESSFIGDIKIDREQYLITRKDGEEIELPRKEFELLSLLMSNPRKVFTREEILEKIWRMPSENKSRTIDVHIRRLREKLGSRYIKTVKGIGYRFQS